MAIHVKIRSASSGKVLDVPNASAERGVQIQQFHTNNGTNQSWALFPQPNKVAAFIVSTDIGSGLVLDAQGTGGDDHTAVIQWTDESKQRDAVNQYWNFEPFPHGSGVFLIYPEYFFGKAERLVLDVPDASEEDGAPIQLYHQHGGNSVVPSARWHESAVASGGHTGRPLNLDPPLDRDGGAADV